MGGFLAADSRCACWHSGRCHSDIVQGLIPNMTLVQRIRAKRGSLRTAFFSGLTEIVPGSGKRPDSWRQGAVTFSVPKRLGALSSSAGAEDDCLQCTLTLAGSVRPMQKSRYPHIDPDATLCDSTANLWIRRERHTGRGKWAPNGETLSVPSFFLEDFH